MDAKGTCRLPSTKHYKPCQRIHVDRNCSDTNDAVTPLLKKPSLDKNVMENLRPVSNLSFISKLTERVVLKRLTDHILCNNLHAQFQSAYKPNHSTETSLMRVHNDMLMGLDNKRGVVLIMLDLSAAFDTVDHSLLLGRMRSAGTIGIAHQWFAS